MPVRGSLAHPPQNARSRSDAAPLLRPHAPRRWGQQRQGSLQGDQRRAVAELDLASVPTRKAEPERREGMIARPL